MTGARAFMGSWTGERGKPSSSLTEMPGTETGNLIIGKYSGNGTVIYRHVIEGNAPKVTWWEYDDPERRRGQCNYSPYRQ